jgi:hypothetical protein
MNLSAGKLNKFLNGQITQCMVMRGEGKKN